MPRLAGISLVVGDIELTLTGNVKRLLSSDAPIPANWTDARAEGAAADWITAHTGDDAYVHIYTRTPLDVAILIQDAGTPAPAADWWARP